MMLSIPETYIIYCVMKQKLSILTSPFLISSSFSHSTRVGVGRLYSALTKRQTVGNMRHSPNRGQ